MVAVVGGVWARLQRRARSGVGGVNFQRRVCQQQETTGAGGQRATGVHAKTNTENWMPTTTLRECKSGGDARSRAVSRESQGPSTVTLRNEQCVAVVSELAGR